MAPVVTLGAKERSVYLTVGTWVDQHGKSYTGPAKFKVLAPLEELPYFKKMFKIFFRKLVDIKNKIACINKQNTC